MVKALFRALRALLKIVLVLIWTPFGLIRRLVAAPLDPVQVAEERQVDRELDVVDQQAEYLAQQLVEEEERLWREQEMEAARREIMERGTTVEPEPEEEWVQASTARTFTAWATAPAPGGI